MIPYLDLKAQYQAIQKEVQTAVNRVLESGHYVLGPEVQAFEEAFASYCGTRYAVAVNTGTSALHLALLAAGVGPGDEVITAITPKTKAFLPVHLHGKPVGLAPLLDISRKSGIPLVEDAAQAHGAVVLDKKVGGLGLAGCFSFYPGKNLGAYGEGGAVTTNDESMAKKVRLLRDWGAEKRYHHDLAGFNFRMEALQGAILKVKLAHLEEWTNARRALAKRYDEKLQGAPLTLPATPPGMRHVHHVYPVLVEKRDKLQEFLNGKGIQTHIHYPIPVHLQKAYAHLGHRPGDFPLAEKACSELLSLPLYPEMTEAQVDEVASAVRDGLAKI